VYMPPYPPWETGYNDAHTTYPPWETGYNDAQSVLPTMGDRLQRCAECSPTMGDRLQRCAECSPTHGRRGYNDAQSTLLPWSGMRGMPAMLPGWYGRYTRVSWWVWYTLGIVHPAPWWVYTSRVCSLPCTPLGIPPSSRSRCRQCSISRSR